MLSILLLVFFNVNSVHAAMGSMPKDILVSGGVAIPSYTTAVHTNPAGIATQSDLHLSLQAGAEDLNDIPLYRGQLGYGNRIFGLAVGLEQADSGHTNQQTAFYGLGVSLPLGLTLGVSGQSPVDGGESDYNAGMFLEPTQQVRLAFSAQSLKNGADVYGLGLGLELSQGVVILVDGAFDPHFKENVLKPGLVLSNRFAGMSFSYGLDSSLLFSDGFTAGIFMKPGLRSNLEFYYNQGAGFHKGYLALTLGI